MLPKMLSVLRSTSIVLALLFLVACSGGILPGSSGDTTGNKNPADIHIGFVSATSTVNYSIEIAAGAQYAANQFHVPVQIMAPPRLDPQAQLKFFEDLTKTARDGIAVETLTPNVFVQPEANAVRAGIPIIAVNQEESPAANVTTFVGNDNIAAGAMLAEAAIERLPQAARGSLIIGNTVQGLPILNYRVQGVKEVFQRLRPDIQIHGPFYTTLDIQQNYEIWNNLISSHPGAIACLGVGDTDNVSLARIKQANHGTYLTAAFDLNEAGLQAVANGTNFALVDPEHFMKGYVAMRLLIEHALYGKAIPKGWWNTGTQLVTQRNVQVIIARQQSLDAKGRYYQPTIDQEFADPAAQIKPIDQAK